MLTLLAESLMIALRMRPMQDDRGHTPSNDDAAPRHRRAA